MSFDFERFYALLPAIHRIRDVEQGGQLRALLGIVAEQVAVLEENLAGLYDDQFIETCAEWVIPYIGDLLGERGVHELAGVVSARAEVGHAIALRRRKGTASALEQVARDTTGYPARVVEFFELLATTQYLNHLRLERPAWIDLRDSARLAELASPFTSTPRTADVRRIASGGGRFNVPNVGVFVWRLRAQSLTSSPATRVDDRRYLFDPLGAPLRLFQRPEREAEITHLAEPVNVPLPLRRRDLDRRLREVYGAGLSLVVAIDGAVVPVEDVCVCNLSDRSASAWAHEPDTQYAIDPVLGRLALPASAQAPASVRVSFHFGFSADIAGGEYDRTLELPATPGAVARVPSDYATVRAAVDALVEGGVVEIENNDVYADALAFDLGSRSLVIRAASGVRPHLALPSDLDVTALDQAELTLDGLLVSGGALRVTGPARRVRISHSTLVPGLERTAAGAAASPDAPSVVIAAPGATLEIEHSIVGALRVASDVAASVSDSIVDATSPSGLAYGGVPNDEAGGPLTASGVTVIGLVWALALEEISNSILLAEPTAPDAVPVRAERLQRGCVRYSYLPRASLVPRRYRTVPTDDAPLERPEFTSLRYGDAGYCQLDFRTPVSIRAGADDEAEMGVFHQLLAPQREINLTTRFDEYLRFGLEAGIFHAT